MIGHMNPIPSPGAESDGKSTAAEHIHERPSWMDGFDLRGELDVLADKIRRHPMLELQAYQLGAPTPAAELDQVEQRLGTALPQEIRWLYGLFSTVTLRWRFRPDLDEQSRGRVIEEFTDRMDRHNLYHQAGAVEFVSLEDMLFHEDYGQPDIPEDGEIEFGGRVYPAEEFSRMVRVFDRVSDFSAMGFVVRPGETAWPMLWLSDHWIDYHYSRMIHLEDYLRFVFAIWAREGEREELFSGYGRPDVPEPMRFDPAAAAGVLPSILTSP